MVIIGGITRLTESGLSITEWNVIMGWIPPLNHQDWQIVFEKYKASPQFQMVNFNMDIEQFKSIFWWEFIHRVIARILFFVLAGGFIYFLWEKKIKKGLLMKKLLVMPLLIALQGLVGWFMVASGLKDKPSVSQYFLALHLILAFITYGYCLWIALELIYEKYEDKKINPNWRKSGLTIFLVVILQIIYGAFVAKLHGGKVYNTWPKMGDEWFPSTITAMNPFWSNFFENYIGVQFVHRYVAIILVILGCIVLWKYMKENAIAMKSAVYFFICALAVQFTLGVITLLYAAPITLAAIHQIGGFVLFTSVVFLYFRAVHASRI